MATYTQNLNLKKPSGTDYVAVGDFNGNTDKLDSVIGNPNQLTTPTKTNLVAAINEANSSGSNAPYIGENGNWFEWDPVTSQYVDSGTRAEGPSGKNADIFAPKGTYATLSALNLAVMNPAQGDYYNVGTAAPYAIYMWDAAQGWVNQGQLQGPDGEPGKDGEPGAAGPNEITTGTAVGFDGIVMGSGGKAKAAVAGTDYVKPKTRVTNSSASPTLAVLDGHEYAFSTALTGLTLQYPGGSFETWLGFAAADGFTLTLPTGSGLIGEMPAFTAGGRYEVSVKDSVAVIGEVKTV